MSTANKKIKTEESGKPVATEGMLKTVILKTEVTVEINISSVPKFHNIPTNIMKDAVAYVNAATLEKMYPKMGVTNSLGATMGATTNIFHHLYDLPKGSIHGNRNVENYKDLILEYLNEDDAQRLLKCIVEAILNNRTTILRRASME